ncbi:MAG TPA: twin-arginine translocation signal domain-containing protein, partial [Thermomicrobiales bacterium]|nr:twin-arginine translocation signal domain-containing protein [Thermomicrobiales bacterium]
MDIKPKRSDRSRFLQQPMHRRRFLQGSAAAAAGSIILPGAMAARESSLDMLPSQNTSTPEAPIGMRMNEGLLPDHRLIMYYGFPENPNMGILGEFSPEELLPKLQAQKEAYEAVINDRPWKMGFELIAS